LVSVRHQAQNNHDLGQGSAGHYACSFVANRRAVPWHPGRGRTSSEPRIYGLQTALVVGPPGEEIHTDEYGRIRVQFHWDREGAYDDKSSAWVRVATPSAGSNFGAVSIPRVGQEVLVQFLDGNPDRPLVTGSVYNQANMPPWELPANKTQSGILSRSSKGAGYDNANAIRFEDQKGQEELWLHAEKNQRIEVENDESHWVGRDRRKTIDRDETNHIKQDRTETVDRNEKISVHGWRSEEVDLDETITIHKNRSERVDLNEKISIGQNRSEDVGQNESIGVGQNQSVSTGQNQSLSVGANRSKTVAKNEKDSIGKNWSIKVGKMKTETIAMASMQNVGLGRMDNVGAAYSLNVGGLMANMVGLSKVTKVGMGYSITAGTEFSIRVGKSSLVMKADGTVIIKGSKFNFEASGPVQISGKDVDVN